MAKKPRPDDLIDWTITYAPEAGEPPPAAPLSARPVVPLTQARAIRPNWRLALIAASPLLLALLAASLSSAWNYYRLRRDVSRVVASEEQSILAGDLAWARDAYPAAGEPWYAAQLRRVENQQPAPLPMHGFWPASTNGAVRAVAATGPTTARAEVVRRYFAPDGSPAVFTLPQFYRFASGAWQRIPPPAGYQSTVHQWRGRYVEASYYAVDEAHVLELSAALDATMAEACGMWACPAGLRFDLRFLLDDAAPLRGFDHFTPAPSTPMLYSVLLAERDVYWGSLTLPLPAPHLAGYPADAESRHVYRRVISLELLARLAGNMAPDGRHHNVLPYALAARLGAELGLESPVVATVREAEPVLSAQALWDFNFLSTERPFGPYYTQAAQRQALAVVNTLLQDQPADAAGRLFRDLSTAEGPVAWVAGALNLSPAAAAGRLQAGPVNRLPLLASTTWASGEGLLLGCRDGLATLAAGQSVPQYALAGRALDARPIAWSPGGEYLLLYLYGHPAVIEARTGAIAWLPRVDGYLDHLQWAGDTIVAYTVWPYDPLRRRFDAAEFSLRFHDVARPAESPAPIPGVLAYALSPDGTAAAIVQAAPGSGVFSRSGLIALMPPLGGRFIPVAEGQMPTWSPDGGTLAYARVDGDTATLHVLEVATGDDRRVFDSAEHDVHSAFFDLWVSWSPQGEALALVLEEAFSSRHTLWVVPASGGASQMLLAQETRAYPAAARFSADGHYLAVTEWNRYWSRLTRVYDMATGEQAFSAPTAAGGTAWSPEGHQLVLSSLEGIALVTEPGVSQVSRLTAEPCRAALWN